MVFRNYFLFFILAFVVACHPKEPNLTLPVNGTLVQNSVKTWKSIDITADFLYTVLGDMYKEGLIDEDKKESLIIIGNVVRQNQELAREAIVAYLWAAQIAEASESDNIYREQIINTIVLTVKSFYKMKDEVAEVYSAATGKNIKIPNIFLFDTITDYLLNEG